MHEATNSLTIDLETHFVLSHNADFAAGSGGI
jgi:hypothetical protein